MSILVIQLPPRARLSARTADAANGLRLPAELDFVLSSDGNRVGTAGRSAPALLPRADSVVLALTDADVSWHRIVVPKAPAAKQRAALAGVLEDTLLEDEDSLHFALGSGATGGQPGWVAVMHRSWLQAVLAALEQAGVAVDRVVPSSAPPADGVAQARGHFFDPEPGNDQPPSMSLASPDGVVCVRLTGALARALQPAADVPVRWTATPAAAAAAERWLGTPVAVLNDTERLLQSAQGSLNLRQFDLAPRRRGTRALSDFGKRLLSPEWRPVRWGLTALVGMQLLGLNLWAFQQQRALADRKQAMVELLRSTHPGVRAVLDAPLQMERETDRLRAAAGRAGDADLEALLAAAAGAWPDGLGPVQTLRFETGRLTVAAAGWGEPQLAQFRERLRAAGYAAESAEGRITVSRASSMRGQG